MALTTQQKTDIITLVNSDEGPMLPEASEGDIMWYPPGKFNIQSGNSYKLKYTSNAWVEADDQTFN